VSESDNSSATPLESGHCELAFIVACSGIVIGIGLKFNKFRSFQ
jgi:hypothetical protein